MTSINPLYKAKQITDSWTDDNWEMDRWEDDGGSGLNTANSTNYSQKSS